MCVCVQEKERCFDECYWSLFRWLHGWKDGGEADAQTADKACRWLKILSQDKMDEPFSKGECQTLTMSDWSEEVLQHLAITSLTLDIQCTNPPKTMIFFPTWPVSRHFWIFLRQTTINTQEAAREINKTALLTEEISKQQYWLLLCLNCNRKQVFFIFYFSSFLRGKDGSGIFPKQNALLLNHSATNHDALASHFLPSSI